MILFDLLCGQGHRFEGWFRDGDSFDRQVAAGEVHCALCGDTDVRKALMAPNISTSKSADARALAAKAEAASASPDEDGATSEKSNGEESPTSVAVKEDQAPLSGPERVPVTEKVAEAMRMLRQLQTHVEKNFDHVGKRFAEEARKMHYGEAEARSIYGEATKDEAEELVEEGIEINRMPWLRPRDS